MVSLDGAHGRIAGLSAYLEAESIIQNRKLPERVYCFSALLKHDNKVFLAFLLHFIDRRIF